MKYQQRWMWFILILGLFVLGCGLFGRAEEAANETKVTAEAAAKEAEAAVQEAAKEVEKAAAEAAKEAEQAAAEAAKEVEQAKEEVAKEVEQAKEEVAKEVEPAKEEVTKAEEMEEAELVAESLENTLQNLSSYRWQFNMEFEGVDNQGQAESGQVKMLLESIKEPAAMHLQMEVEGNVAEELGGAAVVEIYAADDVAYMKNPEDGAWFSFPAEGFVSDFFGQGFFNPDEIIELPDSARRSVLPQEVNGISTWHYTFDETDVDDAEFELEEANGEIWVAREGGYPVKLVLEATGAATNTNAEDQLFTSGTLKMNYELVDVNADFTIEVPEEALSAEGLGDAFGAVDPAEIEWPIMADATVDFAMEGLVSYTVQGSIADVVEFYRAEMPAQGWTSQADSEVITEESALMTFTRDDTELSLIVSKEADGSLSVVLSTTEQ